MSVFENILLTMLPLLKRMSGCERPEPDDDSCNLCGGEMREGIAIGQTFRGVPDFPDGQVCTVSPGGPGKIIDVMKCRGCGGSYTI